METETSAAAPHLVSVVIPVYQGELTLEAVVAEIAASLPERQTPAGRTYRVTEVVLVHDCGPDASDAVIRRLAAHHEWVRPVWLSRNFGQHAATLAGIAASGGRVGRHDGRGRPARPRADRSAHRHRDARTGRRRLRPGHERAAARTGAQHRFTGGQVARHAARQGSTGIRLRELPPPPRRGGPVGRRLRRSRNLSRRGDLVGGAADHDLPHAHARGGGPPVRIRPAPTGLALLAARALQRHPAPAVGQRTGRRCGAARAISWPWCSSPVERPGGGRCRAGPRR